MKTIDCAAREGYFPEVMTVYSRLYTHVYPKFQSIL
jgi:hypothetical protein